MKHDTLHILYSGLGGHASVVFSLLGGATEGSGKKSAAFFGIEPMLDQYKKECRASNISFKEIVKRRGYDRSAKKILDDWIETNSPDSIVVHIPQVLGSALRWKKKNPKCKVVTVEHHANKLKSFIDWYYSRRSMFYSDYVVFLTEPYQKEVKSKLGKAFDNDKSVICLLYTSPSPRDRG